LLLRKRISIRLIEICRAARMMGWDKSSGAVRHRSN
jgi:hypothetical protein